MSYEHLDTWNILLEYADGGSLERFFQDEVEPSRGLNLISFWEEFFQLVNGVLAIHQNYLDADANSAGTLQQG